MNPLKVRRSWQLRPNLVVGILLFSYGIARVPAGLGQIDDVGQETAALKDADPEVRWHAAEALGRSKDPRAVDPLIAALKDTGDTPLRGIAAKALGETKDPRAVEPLIEALRSSESVVCWEAFRALGEIKDPRAVEPMLGILKDPYRYAAFSVTVLEGFGTQAVEPVIAALKDPSSRVRQTAVLLLGKFEDPRSVEPLNAALQDPDRLVRIGATEALGKIKDPSAVVPLVAALKDKDLSVRFGAAKALGQIKDARAVDPLIAALNDPAFPTSGRSRSLGRHRRSTRGRALDSRIEKQGF
ncbi:MAG: HEAT repeat domain-containing protein [Terracidiphilus sp.]|jgi:HEAT repeat protein